MRRCVDIIYARAFALAGLLQKRYLHEQSDPARRTLPKRWKQEKRQEERMQVFWLIYFWTASEQQVGLCSDFDFGLAEKKIKKLKIDRRHFFLGQAAGGRFVNPCMCCSGASGWVHWGGLGGQGINGWAWDRPGMRLGCAWDGGPWGGAWGLAVTELTSNISGPRTGGFQHFLSPGMIRSITMQAERAKWSPIYFLLYSTEKTPVYLLSTAHRSFASSQKDVQCN